MNIPIEIIVGPVGAVAVLVYIARLLWVEHVKDDDDVRAQRDVAIGVGKVSAEANLALVTENGRLVTENGRLVAELAEARRTRRTVHR